MKAASYSRVSTADKQDVTMQTAELAEYVKARQWALVSEYTDKVTGASERRPGLDRLMQEARLRRFDVLVIWKLDRLFRDLRHMVNMVAELQALGVALVSVRDNLDLSTPSGRLQSHIISAMAEFEKALIVGRVRAGVAHARAKGKTLGRPRTILDAAKVAEMRAKGSSWSQIARELGPKFGACRNAHARYLGLHKSTNAETGLDAGKAELVAA